MPKGSFQAVVVGASAGGIQALKRLFLNLRPDSPPVAVVLHLPANAEVDFSLLFPECGGRIRNPREKEPLRMGTVYFAPANYHLLIERNHTVSFCVGEPIVWARPSIDVLFQSAARAFGPLLVGVLLTGASRDGAQGMLEIRRRGGYCLVQNPRTAAVPTMPQAACDLEAASEVWDLDRICSFVGSLRLLEEGRKVG